MQFRKNSLHFHIYNKLSIVENQPKKHSFLAELQRVLDLHAHYSMNGVDPWYMMIDTGKQVNEFEGEVEEMLDEIRSGIDGPNLSSEIGDVFWDLLGVIRKLEDEERIIGSDVFSSVYTKMSTRKPYLLTGEHVTKEEAIRMWNEAKKKE